MQSAVRHQRTAIASVGRGTRNHRIFRFAMGCVLSTNAAFAAARNVIACMPAPMLLVH